MTLLTIISHINTQSPAGLRLEVRQHPFSVSRGRTDVYYDITKKKIKKKKLESFFFLENFMDLT